MRLSRREVDEGRSSHAAITCLLKCRVPLTWTCTWYGKMSCRHKDGNNSSHYICFDASSKLPDLKLMFSFQKETVVFIANQPRPSSKVEAICGRVGKTQSRLHVFRHRDVDLPHCLTNCNMLRISGVGETGGCYLLSQLANLFCVWCSFDNLLDAESSQMCCAQTHRRQ